MKLQFVSHFVDRHGKRRYRFRRKGCKPRMLPGLPGSAEFMDAYQAALQQQATGIGSSRSRPGSLSALVAAYYTSAEWHLLSPSTQRMRRNILERFRASAGPLNLVPYGERRIQALARENLLAIRDRHASTPHQANKLINVLSGLFRFGLDRRLLAINPATGIRPLKIRSDGFHTWTVEQILEFETAHPEGTQARLAFALLNHTGQRRSDVVKMGRQHVHGDFLEIRQEKTATVLSVPITPHCGAPSIWPRATV